MWNHCGIRGRIPGGIHDRFFGVIPEKLIVKFMVEVMVEFLEKFLVEFLMEFFEELVVHFSVLVLH